MADNIADSLEAAAADDDADDDGGHARMLDDMKRSLLAGSHRRPAETRPPSGAMDVHSLRPTPAGASRVQSALSAALGGEAAKRAVSREMRAAKRRHRVLEAPVKLVEAKSLRMAAYERAHKDLGRWYGYVERNRLSEELSFPLPATGAPRPQSSADYRHRARADIAAAASSSGGAAGAGGGAEDLESRLYRRLYSESAIAQAAGGGADSQQQQQQLDGAKIRDRLASSRRLIARRHFLEEKLKRRARIKSKAFRRHARRARMKEELAEMTALKDSDPEAFAERMAALDRARAEERISQRHRGGSRFARDQKLRARFDDTARQAVQEMLQRGRDLSEKVREGGGGDGEGGTDGDSDDSDGAADEEGQHQLPDDLVDDWNNPAAADGSDDGKEEDVAVPAALRPAKIGAAASSAASVPVRKERKIELDLTHLPAMASGETASGDGDGSIEATAWAARRMARMRADDLLADDGDNGDAKEEFDREKAAVAEQEQPKDVDLFLAGWNSWTGPGTRPVSESRRRQFVIKAPRRSRRDAVHGHVIIREKLDSGAVRRRHLVKEVPFPYSNAEQFESAMRAPICREFNSILAHKRLTAPRVSVLRGRAIGPVSKDAILRRKRRQRTSADIAKGKK